MRGSKGKIKGIWKNFLCINCESEQYNRSLATKKLPDAVSSFFFKSHIDTGQSWIKLKVTFRALSLHRVGLWEKNWENAFTLKIVVQTGAEHR